MERIEGEAIRLFCPELADVSVWREAFEGPEASGEVVGRDEVGEMASKLIVVFIMEAFDRRILDRSVQALDLTVGPGMLGLGQAMVDVGRGAGVFDGVSSEGLLTCNQLLDLGCCPTRATGIGEVQAVVGEHGMDFVGNSGDQV